MLNIFVIVLNPYYLRVLEKLRQVHLYKSCLYGDYGFTKKCRQHGKCGNSKIMLSA